MPDDIGRNDPCPCGSGAKYKHCCLRKKKERRDRDSWKDTFRRLNQASLYEYRHSPEEVVDRLGEAWALVEKRLETSDRSLADVERRLGFPPSDTLAELLTFLAVNHSQAAIDGNRSQQRAIEFIDEVFDQFPELEEETANWLLRVRSEACSKAGHHDEAIENAREIIERCPDSAVGRVYAADALDRDPDGDLSEAVELLEDASECPDADEFDVEMQLNELKGRTESGSANELERLQAENDQLKEEVEILKAMHKGIDENPEE